MKITGEIIATPGQAKPFRVDIKSDGVTVAHFGARSQRAAEKMMREVISRAESAQDLHDGEDGP